MPDTFGEIGHYRAAAVVEARERPVHFADGQTCETCHSDVVALRIEKKSRHGRIACQSCHGPLEAHVASEGRQKPALPDVVPLCTRCHEATAGRSRQIPQVNPGEHSGGEKCSTCHAPHVPGTTKGMTTACSEVCPTGARKLADLKDPKDPIHEFLRENPIQVLKAQMATQPKIFYANLDGSVR